MGKTALTLVTAFALLRTVAPADAQGAGVPPARSPTTAEATNRVLGYTGWDDDFLYIAVEINKPNLVGKNSEAFSHPLEDDAVIVSVQADDDRKATARTEHTASLAVSAAHGAQLYLGANAAPLYRDVKEPGELIAAIAEKFKDNPAEQNRQSSLIISRFFKYEEKQKGIPRRDGSFAPGYTVELAVPWIDLGVKPAVGLRIGFNVVAQSRSAGSPPIQSLSPAVKGASDVENPSLWTEAVLSAAAAPSTPTLLTVPRVPATNRVELNGDVTPGEWNGVSTFEFGELATARTGRAALESTVASRLKLELVPRPPRPPAPRPLPGVDPGASARRPQKVSPLVLATYEYDYQGDPRKAVPAANVSRADNASLLAHHPLDGAGPWFSFDRADWHRKQLTEARREGIDVLLPVYRGSARARQLYADKGLDVMVTALIAMRKAAQDYPQIGLFLDTNSLIDALGDRPNLHDPAAIDALYGMIRDFYRRVPAPFRCLVPLGAENGARSACPVFLSSSDAIRGMDRAMETALRSRFAADFPGLDLVVLGADGFRGKADLDGFFAESTASAGLPAADGWIKVATIGAGYAPSRAFADKALPARRDGDAYRTLWTTAIARSPDWVLLDGWNDYTNGREITPSLEAGFSLADTTLFVTRMFAGASRWPMRIVSHDLPQTLIAGSATTVNLRLQNSGMEEWGGGKATLPSITYRWRTGAGAAMGSGGSVPLTAPVLAGQNVSISLPITTGSPSSALAPGEYSLELSVAAPDRRSAAGGPPTCAIPVRIAPAGAVPEWAATVVQTDLPTLLENGGVYEVHATVRNDGRAPWRKADGVRVGLRLYSGTGGAAGPRTKVVSTADASALIDRDVAPGQEIAVRLVLPVVDPQGSNLPEAENGQGYLLCWEIAPVPAGGPQLVGSTLREDPLLRGVSVSPAPVTLVDFDFGARFTLNGTPAELPAGRRLPVRIRLKNSGTETWRRNLVRVGYHWYYQDGSEYYFENETSPIKEDVSPGSQTQEILAYVTPPPVDGTYWLVWDVKFGDTWASTVGGTRVGDSIVQSIQVSGDRLVFANLPKAYNVVGATDSENLGAGAFDSSGRSFPAALLPPYPDVSVVPSGMWLPTDRVGSDSPRRIGFRWGPKEARAKNMIACMGQRVELGKSADVCRLLHLVAASSGKETQVDVRLIFEEPTGTSEDLYSFSVSPWDHAGENKDEIAALTPWHNERVGVKPGAVALYHYAIKVRTPRKLIAIQLPLAPEVKIAAITLEK